MRPTNVRGKRQSSTSDLRPKHRDNDVLELLRRCHASIESRIEDMLLSRELILSEFRALAACSQGSVRASDIGSALGLTPAGTTDVLDRLEDRGLLRRIDNPEDRRSILLELSPRGRRVYCSARNDYRKNFRKVIHSMTQSGRDALLRGLDELESRLEKED